MTTQRNEHLATEKMLMDFSLFNELTEALGKLRKTAMEQKDTDKSGITKLVFDKTGIKIDFQIDKRNVVNAYMLPPQIDTNHPFFSRGFVVPVDQKHRNKLFGKHKTIDAWVNDAEYKVGGAYSNLAIKLCLFKGLMNLETMTDKMLAAIFLHELGHVYTYFSLFGKLTAKNVLTMEAIKELTSQKDLEKRVLRLELLSKDLNIDIRDKEKIAQSPEGKRADLVEAVVVVESAKQGVDSNTTSAYESRNIEQIADQFALYHGAGGDLALGLNVMFKHFRAPESFGTTGFVIAEVVKVIYFGIITAYAPLVGILLLLLCIPGNKIYDDIEARIELTRKQLVQSLKESKDTPEVHKAILSQIEAIEGIKGQLKDRRTFYQLVYQTITPRGRTMYKQEVFMKAVENLLYNDTYLNAARFGALKNEH